MVDIQVKDLPCLSLEEIKKHLPSTYTISTLEKVEIGKQKRDTVVIGEFYEKQRRNALHTGKKQAIRLKLKEVLLNNSVGLFFDVVVFGKTVDLIEEILKSKANSSLMIGFSNLLIVKYTGQEEPRSPYGLKIDDKDDDDDDSSLKQEIKFFCYHNKPKEVPFKYETLNDIVDKKRINVFVVVASIIKQPVVLNNKTKHIMLGLVDPSCSETSSKYNDIPLHIFLNDQQDCFPEPFEIGDILRIRDLLGDLYRKEMKMFGKIFHTKSVVKFKLSEDDDKIRPISSNSSYVLTAQDKEIVKDLREWWMERLEKEKEEVSIDQFLLEKKICEITSPCTFNLNCLVKEVRVVEAHNVVILRITDGTQSNVLTTTINFNNATMDLSSQAEPIITAVLASKEVDIIVFGQLVEKASSLKSGDMIQLIHVASVYPVGRDDVVDRPLLELLMRDEKCEIRQILEHTSASRELLRALSGRSTFVNEESEINTLPSDAKGSLENLRSSKGDDARSSPPLHQLMESFNPGSSSSPAKSLDKTIIEESSSLPPSPSVLVNENGMEFEKSASYPVLTEKVDLHSTDNDVTEYQYHDNSENKSGSKANTNKLENKERADIAESAHNSRSYHAEATVKPGSSKTKRKLCDEQSLNEPKIKILSHIWQPAELDTTVCKTHSKTSLTDFCQKSKHEEMARIWAILKHIHISSRGEPCDKCHNSLTSSSSSHAFICQKPYYSQSNTDSNCYHDWIWGLCFQCGTMLSSADLRQNFSRNDLIKCNSLPCFLCSSSSSNPVSNFEPLFKVELCLEDVINDSCHTVDLCGDMAAIFFGVEPTFKWTVESVPSSFHKRISLFHRLNSFRPFQYCLINVNKNDGSNAIQIFDTKLNF